MSAARRRVRSLVGFVVLVVLASVYVAPRLDVETDIAAMLPTADADAPEFRAARALALGASSRLVVLEVRAGDLDASSRTTRAILTAWASRRMRTHARTIAWIGSRDGAASFRALGAAIDEHPEALGGRDDVAPARAAGALRDLLASPFAADHVRHLPRDPTLGRIGAWTRLQALLPRGAGGSMRDGFRTTHDGRGVIETLALRRDGSNHTSTLALLREAERVARAHDTRLRWSGVAPITARATEAIRADVQRVSTFSTVGVLLLLGLSFGRLRYVFVVAVPLVAGTVFGLACGVLVFGRIHGVALAFAGAMVGVVVDYVEHFLAHRALSPAGTTAAAVLDEIRSSLLMAALTTLVGIGGLAFSGFPGLREVTVVAGAGVLAGLAATLFVVPALVPPHEGPSRLQRSIARGSGRVAEALARRGKFFGVAAIVLALVSAFVLSRARFVEDPASLSGVPRPLLRDDAHVREEAGGAGIVVVAHEGRTCDAALERAEAASVRMARALPAAVVRSPVVFPGSRRAQRARMAAVRAFPIEAWRAALLALDFDVDAFAPFFAWHASDDRSVVTLDAVIARAPMLFESFVARAPRSCFVFAHLMGSDPSAVRAALGTHRGSRSVVVDSRALHAATYRRMSAGVMRAVLAGFLAVVVVCALRYRSLRRTLEACLPAWVAATTALAIASWLGPLDLMHVLGALLVVSMGVDYGIFFVEARDEPSARSATFASVVVSALTTVLSFGVLGLSGHPALASLGITLSLGVTLAVVLAPAALSFTRKPAA